MPCLTSAPAPLRLQSTISCRDVPRDRCPTLAISSNSALYGLLRDRYQQQQYDRKRVGCEPRLGAAHCSSSVSAAVVEREGAPSPMQLIVPAPEPNTRGIGWDITRLVGHTPMVYLNKVNTLCAAKVACKLELMQPGRSVKDRIAANMIEKAEEQGLISPGRTTLVEATSGNMGVSLAFAAAAKGYQLVLTMPETTCADKRVLLQAFGAEVVLTPGHQRMTGAIQRAEELSKQIPEAFALQQFDNPANPEAHYLTTGPEIWQSTAGRVDILIAGVGTGGTITGAGRYLKERNPDLQCVAVEPAESAVLSGGKPGYHQIQGIGAGFVPKVLDTSLLDEVQTVSSADSLAMARRLALEEGMLCGISSGAAVVALLRVARRLENRGKLVVAVLPSFGERYLSTPLFQSLWSADAAEEDCLPRSWRLRSDDEERWTSEPVL